MKRIFLVAVIFVVTNLFSQVEIKIDGSYLAQFYQWEENYVCAMTISSNTRAIALYSKSGQLLWQTKLEVKGEYRKLVVSKNGDYAYLINHDNTFYTYDKYSGKSDLLTIYQFDKTGKFKEIPVPYEGLFAPHLGSQNLAVEYLAGYSGGLIGVLSNFGGEENKWTTEYSLFSLNSAGEITVVNLDYQLTVTDWQGHLRSNLDYHLIEDELIISQLSVSSGGLTVSLGVFDLVNMQKLRQVQSTVALDPNKRYGKTYENAFLNEGEANLVDVVYALSSYPTLGSLFSAHIDNGRLFFVGNYFEPKGDFVAVSELLGYFYFEVDMKSDKDVAAEEVKYVDFDKNLGDIVGGYTVMISDDAVYHCTSQDKGYYLFLNGVNKGKVEMKNNYSSEIGLAFAVSKMHVGDISLYDVDQNCDVFQSGTNFSVYHRPNLKSRRVFHVNYGK